MFCNLCGAEIIGYGNNPAPLIKHFDERCCDDCNSAYVIPARLAQMQGLRFTPEIIDRAMRIIKEGQEED